MLQSEEAADDTEHFEDAPDTATEDDSGRQANGHASGEVGSDSNSEDQRGPAHMPAEDGPVGSAGTGTAVAEMPWPRPDGYDMHKRYTSPLSVNFDSFAFCVLHADCQLKYCGVRCSEPAFCGAEHACLWELCVLGQHMHPSVVAMARTLLAGATIVYEGNPLRDLALAAFLDKFVQKKPKVGSSETQSRGCCWLSTWSLDQ